VPILRLVLILAACAGAVAQFVQERHRLNVIKGLTGRQARDYYEARRERSERFMLAVTITFVLGAATALVLTFATVLIIVIVGGRARDTLRLRQQETILEKLPEAEAIDYYDVLRRRVRNARILRTVTLISLLCIFYAWRHGLGNVLTTR
jgi:hypothetical protein